jgi:hypothetical protein
MLGLYVGHGVYQLPIRPQQAHIVTIVVQSHSGLLVEEDDVSTRCQHGTLRDLKRLGPLDRHPDGILDVVQHPATQVHCHGARVV